ncbi:MAG: hypothetical protein GC189_11580 [Alphaproteobacteria bacterium]|nr:hypothetical protein [Alphaproteobacteria bacterium]
MLKVVKENAGLITSAVCGVVLIFLLGVVAGVQRWFPGPLVADAIAAAYDLRRNAFAYLGDEPTMHLRPRRGPGDGVVVSDPARMEPGLTFMTGVFGRTLTARLYAADGAIVHEWPINFFDVARPEMDYPYDALVHGALLLDNGDILVNLDDKTMMRVSYCGEILWRNNAPTHHSIALDTEGFAWAPMAGPAYREPTLFRRPFRADRIGRFNPDTGELVEEIDLVQALMRSDAVGLVTINNPNLDDLFHLNDVEPLTHANAAAFPMFKEGDLLLSLRNTNQIWVVDRTTHQIKWRFLGPMVHQHDADFQADGTITLLDNRPMGDPTAENGWRGEMGGSRILRINPADRTFDVLYHSDRRNAFYTAFRGKHQLLENGNILIAETDGGRVIEIAPDDEVVWSFINGWDETRVAWVMSARRVQDRFSNLTCPAAAPAAR